MPAIHLQPRLLENTGPGGVSTKSIGLLIGIGLVPVFILIWVVCWLLFAYPHDRNLCCCVRKRHKSHSIAPEMLQRGSSTDTSQETLYEKADYTLPQRPYAAYSRTESGNSNTSGGVNVCHVDGRLGKEARPAWRTRETRTSVQSQTSVSTIAVVQEPERFV